MSFRQFEMACEMANKCHPVEVVDTTVRKNRWTKNIPEVFQDERDAVSVVDHAGYVGGSNAETVPPPPAPVGVRRRKQKAAACPSYILQHYHATGCSGGAFSWRAALMDPTKEMVTCMEPREYRETNMDDIKISKEDKRRGGGPRVGPFQENIPGESWQALPKYDFTTGHRSCAFNERMHVEWENHVDHILGNGGELPTASVVAKAGFRSCAPCCRDMLALARPTGKTFIMVDLAEDDKRGTFHFVTGDKYLPVPKEACDSAQVDGLKKIVSDAQDGKYAASEVIYDAVLDLEVPIDETAQAMYLGDRALLPTDSAAHVKGKDLIDVLHAEHFARLAAEYGASILRDPQRSVAEKQAIHDCRSRATQMLIAVWRPLLSQKSQVDLIMYADAATRPLLPEEPNAYLRDKRAMVVLRRQHAPAEKENRRWSLTGPRVKNKRPKPSARLTLENLMVIDEDSEANVPALPAPTCALGLSAAKKSKDDDATSLAAASTALPTEEASDDSDGFSDREDPEEDWM